MQTGLLKRQVLNKEKLINNINLVLEIFHAKNSTVIFVRHTNKSFSKINTPDWQIDSNLKVSTTDIVINKSRSSIFNEKEFVKLLGNKDIKSIVVTGLVSNGCVQAACLDGMEKGLTVTLLSDAHSTWTKDAEKTIEEWNAKLELEGVKVMAARQYIEACE
jgi:nicotinamidase-related amidase